LSPPGLKPSAAVKLLLWKFVIASTKIVRRGTATFHQVMALLALASIRMPRKLIATKTAMSTTAAAMPEWVSTPVSAL